jgi:hypothetical protein
MEFLKKLGVTSDEIAKLDSLTEEEQTAIVDRVKATIETNVRNDKTLFEEYTKKGSLETSIIQLKKVAKSLGVKLEADDTLDTVLDKGKTSLTANTEDAARKLQDELIATKAELTRFNEEVLPSEIAKVKNEVNAVYIDSSINSTLKREEFKEYLLAENHRPNIYRAEIEAKGGEFKYDPETKQTKLVQKGSGLKFQMDGVTYDETDLFGPAKVIFEPYAKKSNGGANPNPNPGANPQFQVPQGTVISASAQKDLANIDALANKGR